MRKFLGGIAVLLVFTVATGPAVVPLASAQTKPKDPVVQKDKGKTTKSSSASHLTIEIYKDNADEFRFRIKDGDTLLASSGKGYDKKEDVQKVIDNLKANLSKATTDDQSGKKGK